MQVSIKKVDQEKGIVQITTTDERWYLVNETFLPSVTWIVDAYPKGVGFRNYLQNNTKEQADDILKSAGKKGSKVHNAIDLILAGNTLHHNDLVPNGDGGMEELTGEEYRAVESFVRWMKDNNVKCLDHDFVCANEDLGYAGTVDFVCEMNGEVWLIDFKTSADVYESHKLQVSAYLNTPEVAKYGATKMGILQIGYKRNKAFYKLTEVEDEFELFTHTYELWFHEHGGEQPSEIKLPVALSLTEEHLTIQETALAQS